ncbi:phage tail protein [Clostridium culturomicium]|uniref:phage tail protein n=1 Tax=Clostridium culturomicium TaxID=1499683 RepID=UPI003857F37D
MTLEELQVIIEAQTAQFKKEIKEVQTEVKGMTASVNKQVASIKNIFSRLGKFLAALGLGKIFVNSIKSAMDAIEDESLVGTVFGNMTNDIREWSEELQRSLGLNGYAIRKNAAVLFNMSRSMGLAKGSALDLSKNLTLLAEDMASFYNLSSDEAFTKIRAGLVGETEPLKALGIMVDTNTLKQYGYSDSLSNSEKVMIRYQAIMAQTGAAHGDLARTIDSPANQVRLLKTNLQLLGIEFGRAFMPILTTVLPLINAFVQGITRAVSVVATFMNTLFGGKGSTKSSGMGAVASSLGDATDSAFDFGNAIGGAGDSAKKTAKEVNRLLGGFDEITTLTKANDDISGGAGGAGGGYGDLGGFDIGMEEEPDTSGISKAAEKIKAIFKGITDFIAEHKEIILSLVGGLIAGLVTYFAGPAILAAISGFVASVIGYISLIPTAIGVAFLTLTSHAALIAMAIGAVVAAIIYLWQTSEEFRNIIKGIIDDVMAILSRLWNEILKPIFAFLADVFMTILAPIAAFIGTVVVDVVMAAFRVIKAIWDNVLAPLANFLISIFAKALQGVIEIWNAWKPAIDVIYGAIMWIWNNALKPLMNFIVGAFVSAFSTAGDDIKGVFDGLLQIFGGLIDFIVGVFTGNWGKAWQGIVDIVGGIFKGLVNIVKVPINAIIGLINGMIGGLNRIKFPSWVPGIGGKGINIPLIPRLAKGGIVDSPTIAMVGEAGKEAVMPLENNTGWITDLASKVANRMPYGGSTSDKPINLTLQFEIGTLKFAKTICTTLNDLGEQNGGIIPINI